MAQITSVRPQMGFGEAVSTGFKKYVTFSGRARRSEYWWWWLFSFIMGLFSFIPVIGKIITVVMFLPSLTMSVRRLHDIGRTGWWMAAPMGFSVLGGVFIFSGAVTGLGGHGSSGGFIAILGIICLICAIVSSVLVLVWAFIDSKPEANQYGPSPKYEVAGEAEPAASLEAKA